MSAVIHHFRRRHGRLPLDPRLRARVEATIESLIAMLDVIDGDADLEPSLGATEASERVPQWPRSSTDDREAEDEGDELDAGEFDEAQAIDQWLKRFTQYRDPPAGAVAGCGVEGQKTGQ